MTAAGIDRSLLARVAQSAVDTAMARTPTMTMRPGTVLSSEDGLTQVVLDGDVGAVSATSLTPEPAKGDRVMVDRKSVV